MDWLKRQAIQRQQQAMTNDWLAKRAVQQQQTVSTVEQPSIFQVEAEKRGGVKTERTKQEEAEQLIAAQREEQLKFESENVKLDTGEYIPKTEYDKLNIEDQNFIKQNGIGAFNKLQEERNAEQLKNYTLLDSGEYVSNDIYNKLTPDEQRQIKAEGIDKFNEYIEKWNKIHEENRKIVEQYEREAPTLMKSYGLSYIPIYDMKGNLLNDSFPTMNQRASQYTYIRLDPNKTNDIHSMGVPVLKGTEGMAFEIGRRLPEGYTVSFWEMAIGDSMGGAARSQHVTIMDKDGNSVQLPIQVAAKQLIDTGTINIPNKISIPQPSTYNYGDYVNSAGQPLSEQPKYWETKYVKFTVNGKQYVTREEYADKYRTMLEKLASGDDSYASVSMPSPYSSEVHITTKDGKKEIKPLGDAYNTVMTNGKWKPNPYYGSGSSQFNVYIGNPTTLGGTWGNTPATLAAQVSGVSNLINFQTIDPAGTIRQSTQDEIAKTIESTLQQFSPAQMSAYKKALSELKEIAKSAPAGVDPLVVWQQKQKEPAETISGVLGVSTTKLAGIKQSTIDLIDKLNQGLVKYDSLSKDDKDSLSKTAIQTSSGDWTVKEDFARAFGYIITNLGEMIKKEDYDRLGNDTEAQNTLIERGIEYYNKWIEDRSAPEGYVKLGDGNYMKQDDYNSFLDRNNGKEIQSILKDKGVSGLENYINEQKDKLKQFVYTDDSGEKQIDIVNAMREGINNPEIQKAIGSIYTSNDLQDIAKNNIIEPKNDLEKWQVWGEQSASPATVQNLSKENANNLLTGILGNALTEIGKINTNLEGTVGKWRDEQLNKIAPGFADQVKTFAKEFSNVETKQLQSINKSLIAAGEKIELGHQALAGLNPFIGVPLATLGGAIESRTTIPATMANGLLTSLAAAKNAIINAPTEKQREELIANAIIPLATIGAGTAAFFSGIPQKFATSPLEAGRTIGMFIGPEKVLAAAKALKVKLDPRGTSNTALSFQIDVDRIQVPKNLEPAQAHEYIAEIQNRVVEGAATALRENRDVVINDPLTGKAIGHMTAFEQGIKGTMFHAAPDAKAVFIDQINKDREITVGKGGEAQKWGGMFFSEQLAPSFLARRAPTDPVIIATRISQKDIGNPMDISRVQKLMWDGKLSEARDLFLELGRQGKLDKKVYTPFKSYIDSSGIMRIEQELWAAPGFKMLATDPKWYSKKSGVQTAQTYTTSPISVGGKPFLRPRATAVVVDKNNRVLLVRDQGRPYSLPGGLIEKGESAKATVLREIKEETGLDLSNAKISGSGKYIDKEPVYDSTGNVVYIEGRPAYNEHIIFKITVDSFSKAKPKGELRGISSASLDTVTGKKMSLEGYAPVIAGKATGRRYTPQTEFKAEQASLKYGQDVPILWLASENAVKEGLGVPKLSQLYKTELINLVTDIRRMLPWNVKISKVTVDPEATATGSWIGTKLTGVKLEGAGIGKTGQPISVKQQPITQSTVKQSYPVANNNSVSILNRFANMTESEFNTLANKGDIAKQSAASFRQNVNAVANNTKPSVTFDGTFLEKPYLKLKGLQYSKLFPDSDFYIAYRPENAVSITNKMNSIRKKYSEEYDIGEVANNPAYHAEIGDLLGYSLQDIAYFLKESGGYRELQKQLSTQKKLYPEQFTRADETAIDTIVREVETKAREAQAKGEPYEKAFVREANKMASNFEGEYGRDLPYRITGKYRLPVKSIPDTDTADRSSIDKGMVKEFTVDRSITSEKEKELAAPDTERLFREVYTPEKETTERKPTEKPPTEKVPIESYNAKYNEITEIPKETVFPPERPPTVTEITELPPIPPSKPPSKPPKDRDIFNSLSRQQKLASIVWRQGLFYHLIYPPYGFNNVLHDIKPFEGVKIVKGPESAYKSLSRVKGEALPDKLHWDLGMQSILFEKNKKGIIKMSYVPNPKMKTVRRGPVGMPQQETITRMR